MPRPHVLRAIIDHPPCPSTKKATKSFPLSIVSAAEQGRSAPPLPCRSRYFNEFEALKLL